jgi:hypothetical protein
MRISCVFTMRELDGIPADLIVFPEGVCWKEIEKAQSTHPRSVIVAATAENGRSRGVLLHGGQNRIDYWKAAFEKLRLIFLSTDTWNFAALREELRKFLSVQRDTRRPLATSRARRSSAPPESKSDR